MAQDGPKMGLRGGEGQWPEALSGLSLSISAFNITHLPIPSPCYLPVLQPI